MGAPSFRGTGEQFSKWTSGWRCESLCVFPVQLSAQFSFVGLFEIMRSGTGVSCFSGCAD